MESADKQQVEEEEDEFTFEVVKDLSKDQEANLFTFLQKVKKACNDDDSVPDFVGSQVTEWLKELQEKEALE
jgi:hypothetical protein